MTDLRNGLHALGVQHGLDPLRHRELLALAGGDGEPPQLQQHLQPAVALLAALLIGFGVVMWVAANWAAWGRPLKFGLLQLLLAGCLLGAWRFARARAALGLLGLLAQGGLFAYFGQTYKTGADPWQLFALWAVLALPLALAVRHDAVWTPWTLVAAVAVALWVHTHSGHRWAADADSLQAQAIGTAVLVGLVGLLGPWWAARHGAGLWAWRAMGVWSLLLLSNWSLMALFGKPLAPQYWLIGALIAGGTALLWRQGDLVLLSCGALALNVWLLAGLARWLFADLRGDWVGMMFLFGLVAAGLLATTVSLLLRRHRAQGSAA